MKWHWIALCATLGISFACHAEGGGDDASPCEAASAALPHGTLLDLLDPDAPADRRAAALAAYERLATMTQCPEFGYTLGQLYRHGEYLPGNLVAQDIEKAHRLILPMAEDGYLSAFADLAEMDMRHVNVREAMKWTQVYLYFVKNVQADYIDDADDRWFEGTAYNAHLLARVDFLWRKMTRPPLPTRLVKEDLDAWLAQHSQAVTRRMRARMDASHGRVSAAEASPVRVADAGSRDCYLTATEGISSGAATWIIEVLPSGETGRIVLENFVPNATTARKLGTCLSRYRFAPFAGTQSKTVRVPMVMGSPSGVRLRRR